MPTARIPVDIRWTEATGSPGVNVFHARADSLDAFNADFGALSAILEDFYTAIRPLYYVGVTISCAGEAQGVGDDTGSTYLFDPWTMTGSGNQGYLPPADCMLVQWSAQTGGRNGRGRSFLGPLDLAVAETNGTPVEADRESVQDAIDALITANGAFGNGALGVYSRTEDVFRDFVSGSCPNYFAVLRSRRD